MNPQKEVRVLIVEDDFMVREPIRQKVESLGYIVAGEALDGRQAVAMTQSLQPDVVLMDIEMPDMDGLEAARHIYDSCPTPVIMLTAYDRPELVKQAGVAGAGAYLVKMPKAREIERAVTIAMARFSDIMALHEALAELKGTQEKMIQRERLAAVGQLAGGLAHEYNNMMAAIILNADLITRTADLSPKTRKRLETIRQQGERAAHLTQQILDFGQEAMLQPEHLDLPPFLQELAGLLSRTFPQNIQIYLESAVEGIVAHVDPARLKQVIMNLALNARDAMPEGGDLHIKLDWIRVEADQVAPLPDMPIGDWASITVSDNGAGISAAVLPHIFEPFFTTSAPQRSGLGLSQALGIVKQHGGDMAVTTQADEGTTMTVYLPALHVARLQAAPSPETAELPPGNGEIILVTEDDPAMRAAIADCLETVNYRVLSASNGQEALRIYEQRGDEIALAMSDLAMPGMGGLALCRAILERNPAARCLILSGYPLEESRNDLEAAGIAGWLTKPVSLAELTQAVARALQEVD